MKVAFYARVSLGENIDGSTSTGRLMLGIMGSLAEFERERLRERTMLGLARAKRQGKRLGRPAVTLDMPITSVLHLSAAKAAPLLGCSVATAGRLFRVARGGNSKSGEAAAKPRLTFRPDFNVLRAHVSQLKIDRL